MVPIGYHTRRVIDRVSFLSRFEGVKEAPAKAALRHQYTAKCPAHETTHNSLAIGVTHDEMYLVHCYAGCSVSDVLGAAGLSLEDLYPDGDLQHDRKPRKRTFQSRVDDNVAIIGKADLDAGKRLSAKDKARYRDALRNKAKRGAFE